MHATGGATFQFWTTKQPFLNLHPLKAGQEEDGAFKNIGHSHVSMETDRHLEI